jgi:hypothetical protein
VLCCWVVLLHVQARVGFQLLFVDAASRILEAAEDPARVYVVLLAAWQRAGSAAGVLGMMKPVCLTCGAVRVQQLQMLQLQLVEHASAFWRMIAVWHAPGGWASFVCGIVPGHSGCM